MVLIFVNRMISDSNNSIMKNFLKKISKTNGDIYTLNGSEYFSLANINHLFLTELSIENALEIC